MVDVGVFLGVVFVYVGVDGCVVIVGVEEVVVVF